MVILNCLSSNQFNRILLIQNVQEESVKAQNFQGFWVQIPSSINILENLQISPSLLLNPGAPAKILNSSVTDKLEPSLVPLILLSFLKNLLAQRFDNKISVVGRKI